MKCPAQLFLILTLKNTIFHGLYYVSFLEGYVTEDKSLWCQPFLYFISKNNQESLIRFFFFFEIVWREKNCKICQGLAFEHKFNKINVISIHTSAIGLYANDIYHHIVVADKSLNFFWNIFKIKGIKVCHTTTICILSYPVRSYWFTLIKIYCVLFDPE